MKKIHITVALLLTAMLVTSCAQGTVSSSQNTESNISSVQETQSNTESSDKLVFGKTKDTDGSEVSYAMYYDKQKSVTDITDIVKQINDKGGVGYVYLMCPEVKDLSPLEKLDGISLLALEDCNADDYSTVGKLESLKGLRIVTTTALSDTNFLSGLTKLETLVIENNSDQSNKDIDFSALSSDKITNIDIEGYNIENLDFCSGLSALQSARLQVASADLTPLESCKDLTILDLASKSADTAKQVKNLPRLTDLTLRVTEKLNELDFLSGLNELQVLSLVSRADDYDLGIKDISVLSNMKNLVSLGLYSKGVSDYSPLYKLEHLTSLGLTDINAKNIGFLTNFTQLTGLVLYFDSDYSQSFDGDISSIGSLTKLTYLTLANMPSITDYSSLANLSKLTTLTIKNCGVSDTNTQKIKSELPNCQVDIS